MNRIETSNLTLISAVPVASLYRTEGRMAQQDQATGRDLTWDEVRRAIERAAREGEAKPR
ncbi:hypothetical protein [Lentzea sp. NPDC004782]|uniref:hypothetical protein n=1 Tax=Lentzea sp. NPDC004782 TaxID=3154458 RepID=UPI0033B9FFEA